MRICYLCADRGIPLDGHKGASAHVRGFVRAALALGHEVRVVAGAPGDRPLDGVSVVPIHPPGVVGGVAGHVPVRLERALGHLWTNAGVEHALEKTIADFRPDVVYERYSPFSIAGTLIARRERIPHVLEVNAPLAWEGSRYRRQALAEAADAIEHAALALAPTIVAVSAELRERLIGARVDPRKIVVVPNGVDTRLFTPDGRVRRCASPDAVVVGFVGSLKPWHGLDVLARAFRMIAAEERFHLLVVGDGPMAPLMHALGGELPGRVTVVGAVPHEEIPEYLRGVDVAVAPYPASDDFYFSPLKVIEYMATGRPVVASDIGQLRSLVDNGRTGLLVAPGDAEELARALAGLAGAPRRRAELGQAAAAEAHRAHRWEERVARVLELAGAAPTPAAAASEASAWSP